MNKYITETALALAVAGLILSGMLHTNISNLRRENTRTIDNIRDALADETVTREEEDEKIKKSLEEEKTTRENQYEQITTTIEMLSADIEDANRRIGFLEDWNSQLDSRISELELSTIDLEGTIEKVKADLLQHIEAARIDIALLEASIETNTGKIGEMQDNLDALRRKIDTHDIQFKNLQMTLKTTQDMIQERKQEINQLQQQIEQANSQIESQRTQINTVSRQTESLTQDVTEIHREISDMTAGIADLYDTSDELYNTTIDLYNTAIENQREIQKLWQNITEIMNQLCQEIGYWQSLQELEDWLEQDTTDQNEHIPVVYDCDDFATDLARNALKIDRLIYPIPVTTDHHVVAYYVVPVFEV